MSMLSSGHIRKMLERMAKRYMLILSLIFFQGACYLAIIRVLEIGLGGISILGTFLNYYLLATSQNP